MIRNILIVIILSSAACVMQAAGMAIPSDPSIEAKVESTLSRMSLDEKIGQMLELSIDVLGEWRNGEFFLNPAKLQEAIGTY